MTIYTLTRAIYTTAKLVNQLVSNLATTLSG